MQDRTDTIDGSRTFSVLVVEDEIVVAMDLELMIERNGHDVIGTATSVDAALRLLEGNEPDVAVLDANLRGRSVVPVAQRLRCMDVPFVLVSAYTTFGFEGSEVLEGAENVSKPFRERQVIEALHRAIGPG